MAVKKKQDWWKQYQYTSVEFITRAILFAVAVYLFLNYRGIIISANVNGEAISRFEVIRQLEGDYGQESLEGLVNQLLVEQKAREALVQVTDAEVDQEFASLEESVVGEGQSFDEILALQGLSREELRQQIRTQLQIEKLLEGDIAVTDQDVVEYLDQNKDFLPPEMSEDELKELAQEQLRQQKLSERFVTWLDELRAEASIEYFTDY